MLNCVLKFLTGFRKYHLIARNQEIGLN